MEKVIVRKRYFLNEQWLPREYEFEVTNPYQGLAEKEPTLTVTLADVLERDGRFVIVRYYGSKLSHKVPVCDILPLRIATAVDVNRAFYVA